MGQDERGESNKIVRDGRHLVVTVLCTLRLEGLASVLVSLCSWRADQDLGRDLCSAWLGARCADDFEEINVVIKMNWKIRLREIGGKSGRTLMA